MAFYSYLAGKEEWRFTLNCLVNSNKSTLSADYGSPHRNLLNLEILTIYDKLQQTLEDKSNSMVGESGLKTRWRRTLEVFLGLRQDTLCSLDLCRWPQGVAQGASEKTLILWCWEGPLGTPLRLVQWKIAGSQREIFHSWQMSWGKSLGIRKGGIEPPGVPPYILQHLPPKTKVCLFYGFVLSPLTLLGMSPTTISLSLSKS